MSRNIVICCDGTGKSFNDNPTNVFYAYTTLDNSPDRQIGYYDPGIGTFTPSFLAGGVDTVLGPLVGKMFGIGLRENLKDAYSFLMDSYEEGDRIYLFGFSRGAFTVRCLGGVLARMGLVDKRNDNLVPYVIGHYFKVWDEDTASEKDMADAKRFREKVARPCTPFFVGVWDTVNAYGVGTANSFPNRELGASVAFGYQALSIDERRLMFRPSLWQPRSRTAESNGQLLEQRWFAGVHSDVGGGYAEQHLSNIALVWLLEKAEATGLRLHSNWRSQFVGDPAGVQHDETGTWPWRILRWLRIQHIRDEIADWHDIDPSVGARIASAKVAYDPPNVSAEDRGRIRESMPA